MIVRFAGAGKSFKGLVAYLTHDPKAKTSERVDWAHTLNLANDHVPSAVHEMLGTYRSADLLKQEAGVKASGRRLKNPAKHFSLGWHPSDKPSREDMIGAVQDLLQHLGWHDHQAVLVAHNDKHYKHVHVMLNAVSPIDGRSIDTGLEKARASAWALQYEQSRFKVHCEERLKPYEEREKSPTRESWQQFKGSEVAYEQTEKARLTKTPDYFERHDAKGMNGREWNALKDHQRKQREQFFVGGKEAFRAVRKEVFREVREEFRPKWKTYYAARQHGDDPTALAATKASLMKAQNAALDERRTKACDELRERRDHEYEAILDQQRVDRAELGRRQQQGLRTYQLFDTVYPVSELEETAQTERTGPRWKVHGGSPEERTDKQDIFGHAGQFAIDPYAGKQNESADRSGVFRHGAPIAPEQSGTDALGRSLREAEAGRARQAREPESAPEPIRTQPVEMTEAASEKARSQKAREMNEQRDQADDAAALHASWARKRSRGSRDRGRV